MSNTACYQPLASIALATYNGDLYLRQQLDSLLAQTYQNFEIVISDDGSSDSTRDILKTYADRDKRIVFFQNPGPGKGVVSNFTSAITRCQGEIIFFCDQDDVWYPNKLEKHIAVYQDQSVEWAYNEVVLTDESLHPIGHLTDSLPTYWTRRKLLYYTWGSCVLGCATSYRASTIKSFWPADPLAPGHDSWIQLAIYPAKAAYIPEVLQDYRQHGKNAVGFSNSTVSEAANEKLAISNNLSYLRSLAKNRVLQPWKRCLFMLVYQLKIARALLFGRR